MRKFMFVKGWKIQHTEEVLDDAVKDSEVIRDLIDVEPEDSTAVIKNTYSEVEEVIVLDYSKGTFVQYGVRAEVVKTVKIAITN